MKHRVRLLTRGAYALLALGALIAPTLPFLSQAVSAAQVTSRSIQLSNATPSASSVTYNLTFTPVTTSQELIIDFCSDTPIIGATCAFASTSVPNVASVTASAGTVSAIGTGTPKHTIKVTGLTMTGGTPYNISFGAIVNPSTAATFYARILTYGTGNATGYAPANTTGSSTTTGTYVDYGGAALSTSSAISLTAVVAEALTFCVSGTSVANCSAPTSTSLTIGHTVGGQTILDNTVVDTVHAYTVAATNAQSGVSVRMKNTNASASCGGLSSDNGTTCGIPAAGASVTTITAGTAALGMCVTTGSANTTATSPYNNSGCTQYGFDQTTSNNNVLSTYGSQIFTSTGTLNNETDDLKFAATAATTTKAGVYTATYSLICTGTF